MSVEQAKAFIEKMKTDEAFREQIMAIETPEERLKAIGEAGFDCTGEEINAAGVDVGDEAFYDLSGGYLLWTCRN
ncbi:Nif11-like leader peptide family natural product precursor [Chlorobium limicola]